VLATVQAELLRCILFGARADNDVDLEQVSGKPSSDDSDLPVPTESELQIHLGEALLTILSRVRKSSAEPIVVVSSSSNPCTLENIDTAGANVFSMAKFDDSDDEARCFIASILPQFTTPSGVVLFLMSVIMTRGMEQVCVWLLIPPPPPVCLSVTSIINSYYPLLFFFFFFLLLLFFL
jgi:hypothetical protein